MKFFNLLLAILSCSFSYCQNENMYPDSINSSDKVLVLIEWDELGESKDKPSKFLDAKLDKRESIFRKKYGGELEVILKDNLDEWSTSDYRYTLEIDRILNAGGCRYKDDEYRCYDKVILLLRDVTTGKDYGGVRITRSEDEIGVSLNRYAFYKGYFRGLEKIRTQ